MRRASLVLSLACAAAVLPFQAHAQFTWRDNGIVEGPPRSPYAQRGYAPPSYRPYQSYPANPAPNWNEPGWNDPRWNENGRPYGAASPPQQQSGNVTLPPPGQGEIRDGGARPAIAPVEPPTVRFAASYPAKTIVIATDERRLYYVLPGNRAYAYQISVGREGFDWYGTETISRKQEWPDWHPPAEMRQRDPNLPEKMTGGIKNPLGAVALYLGKTLYRIHGTNDEKSLGQAQSSGCFRMMNGSAMHLASIADVGTTVHVVKSVGGQAVSRLDPPAPPVVQPAQPQQQQPPNRQAQAQPPRYLFDERWDRPQPGSYNNRPRRGVWDW